LAASSSRQSPSFAHLLPTPTLPQRASRSQRAEAIERIACSLSAKACFVATMGGGT
jgi:hypothetical protein